MKKYTQTLVIKLKADISEKEYKESLDTLESEEAQLVLKEYAESIAEEMGADFCEIIELTYDMENE